MSDSNLDYRKAFETAKRQLAELIASQEQMERKKIALRKTIETLGALFESNENRNGTESRSPLYARKLHAS